VSKIEIYTSPFCGFCWRAKSLLSAKGVEFEEHDVTLKPGVRDEMIKRAGSRTVPQVFADGQHIGDCDAIHMLDARGELDQKLGLAGQH